MHLYLSQNLRSTEQTEWNTGASAFDFLLWNTSTCNEGEQRVQRIVEDKTFGGYSASETRDFVKKGKKIKLQGKMKRIIVCKLLNLRLNMRLLLNKESNPMEILLVLISKISNYKSQYLLICLTRISSILNVKFGVYKD